MRNFCGWFKSEKVKIFLSCVILEMMGIVFFIIQYYQLLCGDDILFQYEHSHYVYTGLKNWELTKRITNISMMIREVFERWLYFSGRISTVFFVPLLNILGQFTCSIIGSFVYVIFILCMGRIIWKSWKEMLLHPLGLFVLYLLQFHFSPTASYMQMWTFVCHYSMPIVLCMLYYIIWTKESDSDLKMKNLILMNIFGFFVGATHELLPVYCFLLIGIRGIIKWKNRCIKPLVISNIGIFLGFLLTFFAPGNFIRMNIPHDRRRLETGLGEKLNISFKAHCQAMGLENLSVKIILTILIVAVFISVYRNRKNLKAMLLENIEFMVAGVLSVFMWAVVAPPVAQYSLPFFKAVVLIFMFRMINIRINDVKIYSVVTGLIICAFLGLNVSWCRDLVDTTNYRRLQIQEAVQNGEEEVVLIDYPESTSNYFTDDNMGNLAGVYPGGPEGKDYYGIVLKTKADVGSNE